MYEASVTGKVNRHDATHRKGSQMRYRATFAAGLAVGFVLGARAGRERYDQLVKYGRQIAGNPAVQKATSTVTAKTTELTKTAAAKAPDLAKTASAQVPKIVATAKEKAAGHLPSRFGGKGEETEEAEEGAADAFLVHPDDQPSVNGVRYSAD